jgi:hypothetical protein
MRPNPRSSILSFAPGRRPYVAEESGALVVKAAPMEEIAIWLPGAASNGTVQLQVRPWAVESLSAHLLLTRAQIYIRS